MDEKDFRFLEALIGRKFSEIIRDIERKTFIGVTPIKGGGSRRRRKKTPNGNSEKPRPRRDRLDSRN